MNGADRLERRKSLKERLGLTGICFGASWGPVSIHVRDDEDPEIPPPPSRVEAGDLGQVPVASGVNLAAALASERNYLPATDASVAGDITVGSMNDRRGDVVAGTAPQTPSRVSLMRLLWETDGGDGGGSAEEEGGEGVYEGAVAEQKGVSHLQPSDPGDS
ncbi:unnamed protein product [Thlaspi arvense]|uniref:Uncharacterized protein n=1 Tax=Thlaspi arvense TaxID=13288 RepID=A0AAU9RWH7_THLAR|nr:unnamed protein product [Thlaspi arvense]